MTCKQLGGACNKAFQAGSFDELAELSKLHGMEMFQQKDAKHLEAMQKVTAVMQHPRKMQEWFDVKRKKFEALAED